MTLYEKQQVQWQNRLEQERRNISVSVEETLTVGDRKQRCERFEGDEVGDEAIQQDKSGKSRALIPPRLSLQSKVLPAIRSGSFVQSATAAHAVLQQTEGHLREQKQEASQTNIFARLAQRVTSSFAAFTLPSVEQVQSTVSFFPAVPPSYLAGSMPRSHEPRHVAVCEHQEVALSTASLAPEDDGSMFPRAKVIDAIPATPSTRPLVAHQHTEPQRLARHTTKIRLQAAPHPQTTPLPVAKQTDVVREVQAYTMPQSVLRDEYDLLREPLVVSLHDVSQVSTCPDLVAVAYQENSERNEPLREASEVREQREQHKHETIFGTHAFESGQAEVMILQDRVQSSSVVHITLTSSPGQTLVQYVSLHPQAGFTVHLTAPASARTTFNYALLVQLMEASMAS